MAGVEFETGDSPFEILADEQVRVLSEFETHGVEFIVVGGYAVRVHGYLRFAPDLDLLIHLSSENLSRFEHALAAVGVGDSQRIADLFRGTANPHHVLHIFYVDLLGAVESLRYEDLLPTAVEVQRGTSQAKVVSRERLIEIKERSLERGARKGDKEGRDRRDVAKLKELV
jgi:hypothetical protein